jgi:hypothetical protein
MNRRLRLVHAFASLIAITCPATALAQSFNCDVGDNLILWPTPSAAYGGAAAQTGFWNAVKTPYSVSLKLLDGSPSGVTCTSSGSNAFNYPFSTWTGDDLALMADCQSLSQFSGTIHWTFQGLADGSYVVYTYAHDPANTSAMTSVEVLGSSDPQQQIGGAWSGSPHVIGLTYAVHHVTVTGGLLHVDVAAFASNAGSINGFQIVSEGTFSAVCAGDGSLATPCPCANSGLAGRGCDNSLTTGGALLTASGATNPDTVVITSSNEIPTALSIFLQGNTFNGSGVVFGDGVRCVAGSLKRIAVRNAVGGTVSYPQPGDPSISQQSATLGDPIAPGSTRFYQVYYRDSALGFCPAPTGNSWNVSSGLAIHW